MSGNPVSDATVTLLNSDSAAGPFTAVLNGSAVMSPGNRNNPETTSTNGQFGWDVAPGYYEIEASAPACDDPVDPSQDFVTTSPFPVPPEADNISLVLACTAQAITSPSSAAATAGSEFSFTVTSRGTPAPKLKVQGKLPKGVHFVDNHNGTGTLTGSPTSTSKKSAVGTYKLNVKATFGKGKTKNVVTQAFTLTVT
jgi:hypothetical protein